MLSGQLAIRERVVLARERLLPVDHIDLLAAKLNLAGTRWSLGDLEGARELDEYDHAARERLLPADHPDLLAPRSVLWTTRGA